MASMCFRTPPPSLPPQRGGATRTKPMSSSFGATQMNRLPIIAAMIAAASATNATAQEVFAGAAVHGIDTPLSLTTDEDGIDLQLGIRSAPIRALGAIGSPSAQLTASVNTAGDSNLAVAGLSWQLGGRLYARPGIGLAVHDGPSLRIDADGRHTELGSRILFAPELGIGYRFSDRVSIEAHWLHISHARLFNHDQNPGLDMMGLRINWRL